MGLLPEFFMLLGIEIFLGISLLSALLDGDVPSFFQYLPQGAAMVGLGLLFASQSLVNAGILARDPTDVTRFWLSVVYLASAVSSVIGLNVYLAAVRREVALASTFTGTVAVPTLMVSAIFVSSFLGNGEVSFTPAAVMMLTVAALAISVSIFGFLRQASRRLSSHGHGVSPTEFPAFSEVAEVSKPSGPRLSLPWHLPSKQQEKDWRMKDTRDVLDLKHKKSLRLGLLLLSTLFIVSASALVYAGIVYERALDVGNTSGANTGSGSTSAEVGFTPATIMMMAVAAFVIGLSLFGLLREASKHVGNVPGGQRSSPTGPVSMPPGAMGIDLPLRPPSMRGEDWEESPKKEEGEG